MDTNLASDSPRSWTDLPFEILSFIAIRLPIIELLSFRGTCKDFRSASSTATAEIQSSKNPWLLFHKTNSSKCIIYNEPESKPYNRKIPELETATCLASYQGWLLLFKDKSIFFFSPFPLSKITLPEFPQNLITRGHVAAFSDQPTSPHCIISIINPIESPFFEMHIISKGQKTWTRHKIRGHSNLKPILTAATYDNKSRTFYYMVGEVSVLSFSVEDKKATPYTIVHGGHKDKDTEVMPYVYYKDMFHNKIEGKICEMDIGDDEYVDVCGLTFESEDSCRRELYLNEVVNESPTRTQVCKAVWIQPRFYESNDQDLHW
ncbi:hypothetical protein L1987_21929 [Smallanthus sonchifolius]|uniref:Uncharacterized protein n=1 Tax=Smallanthus sonchifolius TaxID=185202 RepID=A0ACB9IDH1_9ASTR|nr:hypothetical protein L1987_21929 [Smallanthus sonchifolius]